MFNETYLLSQIFITFISLAFLKYIYQMKYSTLTFLGAGLIIPIILQLFIPNHYICFIFQPLIMLVFLKYKYPQNHILEYFLVVFYMMCLGVLSYISITWIMNLISYDVIFPISYIVFLSDFLFLIILFLTANTIKKFLSKTREYSYILFIIIILLMALYSSYIVTIFQKNELLVETSIEIILMTLLVILVYNLVKNLIRIEKENSLMKLHTQELMLNQKNYDNILENIQETRKINHDINHLLRGLLDFYNQGDYSKMKDTILSKLEITNNSSVINTGNQSIDLILSSYVPILKKNNIEFVMNYFDGIIYLDKIDLYTLVGNLLDNAIENCSSNVTKKIIFDIYENNHQLCIDLKNTCMNDPTDNVALFQTTKENKQYHGIGLKSVDMIVKKYEGSLTYEYSVYYFTIHIKLKNSKPLD